VSRRAALLPQAARRPTRRRVADAATGWSFAAPSVIIIAIFGMVPVLWSVYLSFEHSDLQTPGTWAGFSNYRQLAHDPVFRDSVKHSLIYTVVFVPVTLILSMLAAAALNRRIRGITFYRTAVFVPVVTSTVATGMIFNWLLDPDYGIVNSGLSKLGLPQPGWFSSTHTALAALIVMTIWGWIGFGALIFLAGLQSTPNELLEAAALDGCTPTAAFWRIQVPLLRPVSGFLLVWLTINALQLFDEVYVTTKGGPLHATTTVVYYLYQQAFSYFHAGYAAAIAIALFVVIIVITLIQMWVNRAAEERA